MSSNSRQRLPYPEVPEFVCDARTTALPAKGMKLWAIHNTCSNNFSCSSPFMILLDELERRTSSLLLTTPRNSREAARMRSTLVSHRRSSLFRYRYSRHLGLFAPSAGQHLRDEQRRRRSQYDRGTSLAEREEFGYDDGAMQAPYIGYPQCRYMSLL
jgi:hypothetical protein